MKYNKRNVFNTLFIILICIISCTSSVSSIVITVTGQRITVPQETRMCQNDPSIPWCRENTPCKDYNCAADIDQVLRRADSESRSRFTYRNNPPNLTPGRQRWSSHSREVMNGARWSGECDQMMNTVLDLAIRWGVPSNHVWRALVMLPEGDNSEYAANHAVGLILDQRGTIWVVGDVNNNEPYPLTRRLHIVLVSRADRGLNWERYSGPEQLR